MKKFLSGKNIIVGIITLIIGVAAVLAIVKALAFGETSVNGNVVSYILNPEARVEGVILDTGDQVRFGAKTGELIVTKIKVGDNFSATGRAGSSSNFGRELMAESLQIGEETITVVKGGPKPPREPRDRPHPPRGPKPGEVEIERPNFDEINAEVQPPAPKETVQVSGKVQFIIVDRRGEAKGVILSSGEQLNLPKEVKDENIEISQNTDLVVSGEISKSDFGSFIKPTVLTIGNQTFSFNR